ncbi:MAG: patatin-like phospholipase family protein [Acidobacteriia bacterium]|nr:patatin-like phospholipase family protein [Terriglobia bacterium]
MRQLLLALLIVGVFASAQAIDCTPEQSRALVLSGGGAKGAFEAGAIYHLVVDRHCDFKEMSGVSVGALNGSFLAQASSSSDPERSLRNLGEQAEELVKVWESIKGPQDIFKKRFLGMLRFGLFKIENLNDFTPLHNLINEKVSPNKLLVGRTVRVGVVSFWDGRYREVVASKTSEQDNQRFLDYVFAGSLIPIYGRMPQIQDDAATTDKKQWTQFADAGLRRVTPVSSYFMTCDTSVVSSSSPCNRQGKWIPAHEAPINQLFVIMTSPYSRSSDEAAIPNPDECCQKGTRKFSDGHKILERTIALSVGVPYRWDLSFAQIANEFLGWRQEQHNLFLNAASPSNLPDAQEKTPGVNVDFPIESYNPGDSTGVPSLPYEINVIVPQKIFADIYGFDPPNIREQLYCGCMAADQVMSHGDSKQSMSAQCAQRFPKPTEAKQRPKDWDRDVCSVVQARKK